MVLKHPVLSRVGAAFVAALLALGLVACVGDSRLAEGTSVTVALPEAFTSYNPQTGHGSASDSNASVFRATNSSFARWSASGELVFDESFGTVEKLSDDPLTVRYTVAEGVQWSDGAEVDAADLLLAWAANSRAFNDEIEVEEYVDPETGLFTDEFPDDAVYFDGFTANGVDAATRMPELTDDGRGITLVFDDHVSDWATVFTVGLPAHIVARQAFGLPDDSGPDEAKEAVVRAIGNRDSGALADLSRSWNSDFVIEGRDVDAGLLVGTGPYVISELNDGGLSLTANPRYRGDHLPRFETIRLRHIAEPLEAVAALERGEVDVVSPRPSVEVMAALGAVDEANVEVTLDGVWEVLQPRFDDAASPAIEDSRVREALLLSVPRNELVDAAGAPGADATVRESFTLTPGSEGYDESLEASDDVRVTQDLSRARSLVRKAAADDASLGAPQVCILFDPANPRRVAQFSAIQDAAASVGITVTDCSSPDWRNLLGTPGSWDAALYGLRERNLAVQGAEAMFLSDSPLNHGGFASDEVDAVVEALSGEDDADARAELRAELDLLLWQEGWGLPLAQLPLVTATAPGIEGIRPSPYAPTVLHEPWRWRPSDDAEAG